MAVWLSILCESGLEVELIPDLGLRGVATLSIGDHGALRHLLVVLDHLRISTFGQACQCDPFVCQSISFGLRSLFWNS